MSISKLFLSEKLIEGYVKAPPSLKELTLTKLAIQLCQYFQLKQDIICASHALSVASSGENTNCYITWENLIGRGSKAMCEALSLPPLLSPELIVRIRSIALELFSWNKEHQAILNTSAYVTDQFLTASDWTIEGRLDEAKIAERLVQDEKIPVFRRYLLACIHSLEAYILPLWDQCILQQRDFFHDAHNLGKGKRSKLVEMKSYQLAGELRVVIGDEYLLWKHQLYEATDEGARTAFVNFWKILNENQKQGVINKIATYALTQYMGNYSETNWMSRLMRDIHYITPVRPAHYSDIIYFLFSQMSQEQRISFFREAIDTYRQTIHECNFDDRMFACFLQWPYQEFFVPIITNLWGILPEDRYAQQLLMLAHRYTNRDYESIRENQDYHYGALLLELLEKTPECYKRYIYKTTIPDLGTTWGMRILSELTNKQPPHSNKDKNVFQRFLRQATLEEKHSIIYSQCGEKLRWHLIYIGNLELVECILNECLTNETMAHFKKQFLLSCEGKSLCFWLLNQESESAVNLFLNWGCFSEEEISAFKSEVFFGKRDKFKMLLQNLNINQLDRVMWRYLPTEAARQQYKAELIEEIGMDVCTHFIMGSKWEELTQFLNWCFSSEEAVEQFKQGFFAKRGVGIHSRLALNQQWKEAEHFFAWCRLSPMAIKQLKKDFFSSPEFFGALCQLLYEGIRLNDIARTLSCIFVDEESVIAFDGAFREKKPVEFHAYAEHDQQRIQRNWDKLIKAILREKSNQDNKTQKVE